MKRLLLAWALAMPLAHAEFITGNKLHEQLNSSNNFEVMMGMGYVAGVADATRGNVHCMPNNVTLGQIVDMVKKVLESQPQNRHNTADVFIAVVLMNQWPCPKKARSGI